MKSNEILELVRAGFTKEEIMAMDVSGKHASSEEPEASEEAKESEASEEPKEPETSAASEESAADNAPAKANQKFSEAVKNFEAQMDALTKKFQDNNILLSSMKSEETLKTGEDIIAELINPPEVESEYAKRLFGGKEK